MAEQGEIIEITPEGPDAAIARHSRRSRNRMATGMVAMLVAVIGGFGLWSLSSEPEPVATQVTSIGRDAEEREQPADAAAIEPGAPLQVITVDGEGAPANAYRTVVDNNVYYVLSTAPGAVGADTSADFDDWPYRENTIYQFEESQGWTNVEVKDRWISDFRPNDGVLYVLSTGRSDGSLDPAVGVSSDRGATWEWQSISGLEGAAAINSDGLGDSTLRLVPAGDRQFVIAQSLGYADWDEGIALAKAAGVPVTGHRDVIYVDHNGISYNPTIADDPQAACWEIEGRYYDMQNELYESLYPQSEESNFTEDDWYETERQVKAQLAERSGPFEAELVAAGCDNSIACNRIQDAYYSIGQELYPRGEQDGEFDWRAVEIQVEELRDAQAPEIEAQLEAAGCENTIRCDRVATAAREPFWDQQDELASGWDDYDSLTEAERDELAIREQVLWQQIEAATEQAFLEAGCDSYFSEGYEGEGYAEDDYNSDAITTVTWAELGVEVPSSWSPSSTYYELSNGGVVELAWPFGDQVVVQIDGAGDDIEVVTVSGQTYYGPFPTEPEPDFDRQMGQIWATADGATWTAQGQTSDPFGGSYGGPGPVSIGNVAYRLNWAMFEEDAFYIEESFELPEIPVGTEILIDEESGEPYFVDASGESVPLPLPPMPPRGMDSVPLERAIDGGAWESITLADLGVSVPETARVDSLQSSPVGIFMTVREYMEESSRTTILFSSDGTTWSSYVFEADFVSMIAGPTSVLLIGADYDVLEPGEAPVAPTTVLIKPAS